MKLGWDHSEPAKTDVNAVESACGLNAAVALQAGVGDGEMKGSWLDLRHDKIYSDIGLCDGQSFEARQFFEECLLDVTRRKLPSLVGDIVV